LTVWCISSATPAFTGALAREKQIKRYTRLKKIALIVSQNPTWKDLSAEWYARHRFEPEHSA
jgi:predicted GIY-YIG superfamily endonuclease